MLFTVYFGAALYPRNELCGKRSRKLSVYCPKNSRFMEKRLFLLSGSPILRHGVFL